jgi:putative Mg2+ transporter-C (MgtC) family protein
MSGGGTLPLSEVAIRLSVAAGLGAAIGLERERLERAAGLRTHAIVAVSAALIIIVSAFGFEDALGPDRQTVLDPSRVAAQVVSGIGFLGAGVIIFRKNAVRGLTTAASVWAVAGIGLAAGGGLIAPAFVATAIILAIQAGLRPIERHFFQHHRVHQMELRVRRGDGRLAAIESSIFQANIDLRGLRLKPARSGQFDRVALDLGSLAPSQAAALIDTLRSLDGVQVVSYTLGELRSPSEDADDDARDIDGASGRSD